MERKLAFMPYLLAFMALPLAAQGAVVEMFWKTAGHRPFAVAFDGRGAMYVVTAPPTGDGLLSRVTPDGEAEPVAVLEGGFIGPGIDVGEDGTVYVTVGDKLLAVDARGGTRIVAGGFARAMGVKLDRHGGIYVADDLADTVYRISEGKKEAIYRGKKTGPFVLTGLAFDRERDRLYFREGNAILALKPAAGSGKTPPPETVAAGIDAFCLCTAGEKVFFTATSGRVSSLDGGVAVTCASGGKLLQIPIGIAPGGKGFDERSLYVAVAGGIVKITPRR